MINEQYLFILLNVLIYNYYNKKNIYDTIIFELSFLLYYWTLMLNVGSKMVIINE